jgi:membrane associated rhomboid family serine protease
MPHYYARSSNPFGGSWTRGIVNKLVIINVAVFVLEMLLSRTPFIPIFALSPKLVLTRGFVWQLLTYMFLHGGFWHLALNMFIIWMFGSQLEAVWGGERFLKYYLICGIGGALFSFIFAYNSLVIGASGAGYGILLAYAVLFPYNQVYVWGIFPVRARTLVIGLAAIEFLSGIAGRDGIAHFAHLGGMAAGLLYMRTDHRALRLWKRIRELFGTLPVRIRMGDENDEGGPADTDKIDSILDTLSEKGYENLTETERRILENYSKNNEKH